MEKYAAIQEKLGFRTWWLEQSDSGIDIILDGKKIDVFVRGKKFTPICTWGDPKVRGQYA